jgi:hypothetical protein
VSQLEFKLGTSKIKVRNITVRKNLFGFLVPSGPQIFWTRYRETFPSQKIKLSMSLSYNIAFPIMSFLMWHYFIYEFSTVDIVSLKTFPFSTNISHAFQLEQEPSRWQITFSPSVLVCVYCRYEYYVAYFSLVHSESICTAVQYLPFPAFSKYLN